jgi:hypothetical protein
MDIQKLLEVKHFDFYVDFSLEECLERLEAYKQKPQTPWVSRKATIHLSVVEPDTVYRIQANQTIFADLDAEIEVEGDETVIYGTIHLSLIPFFLALFIAFVIVLGVANMGDFVSMITTWLIVTVPVMIVMWMIAYSDGISALEKLKEILAVSQNEDYEEEIEV